MPKLTLRKPLLNFPPALRQRRDQYLHGAAVLQDLALNVAEDALGMERDDVIFLAYPDGALHKLTKEAPDDVVRSPYTEKDGVFDSDVTPYRIVRSGQGVPYSFNAIMHDLNDMLVELNPREIYLPSPASADETVAAAGRLIARSLREVAPRKARVLVYMQDSDLQQAPDQRILVTARVEKQRALDMYAERIGIADWPRVPAALLEEELFWEFDYADAA